MIHTNKSALTKPTWEGSNVQITQSGQIAKNSGKQTPVWPGETKTIKKNDSDKYKKYKKYKVHTKIFNL